MNPLRGSSDFRVAAALAALLAALGCSATAGTGDGAAGDATPSDVRDADVVVPRDVVAADVVGADVGAADVVASCGAGLGECDPVAQTGCPPGQSCVFTADAAGALAAHCGTPGAGIAGVSCARHEDCARGTLCAGGQCVAPCCGPGDDARCAAAPSCYHSIGCGAEVAGSALWACLGEGQCDPVAQNCSGGQSCVPVTATETMCVPTGTTPTGAACTTQSCVRGSACLSMPGGASTCRRLCPLPESDPARALCRPAVSCGAGEVCTSLGGGLNLGACVPP